MSDRCACAVYVGFYFQNVTTFFQPTVEADGALVFRQPLYKHTTLPLFDVNDTGNVVAAIFDKVPQCDSFIADISTY